MPPPLWESEGAGAEGESIRLEIGGSVAKKMKSNVGENFETRQYTNRF